MYITLGRVSFLPQIAPENLRENSWFTVRTSCLPYLFVWGGYLIKSNSDSHSSGTSFKFLPFFKGSNSKPYQRHRRDYCKHKNKSTQQWTGTPIEFMLTLEKLMLTHQLCFINCIFEFLFCSETMTASLARVKSLKV